MTLPRIGITLGDPAGIGPEIIVKTLSQPGSLPAAHYVLFGSRVYLKAEEEALGLKLDFGSGAAPGRKAGSFSLSLREEGPPSSPVVKGKPTAESGLASFRYFQAAVAEAEKGTIQAIVTAPISKLAWSMAEIPWRGHTEYLEQAYPQAIMAFWSDRLKVALLSHHLPLREALARVEGESLDRFLAALQQSLDRAGLERLSYLVAGLNPHAGEEGLMGGEERFVFEAVRKARAAGMNIQGPFPPDTVFRMALDKPDTMVVALYHDQGLIPFKLVAFETGVNLTLGLPFVRTSPDHGTAFDITSQRTADPRSLIEAVRLAGQLAG